MTDSVAFASPFLIFFTTSIVSIQLNIKWLFGRIACILKISNFGD